MSAATLSPLAVSLPWWPTGSSSAWSACGLAASATPCARSIRPGALLLAWCGWLCLGAPPQTLGLPLGLPDLPFHLRADALSGFFLLLLGLAAAGVLAYSTGYFRGGADS